MRSFEEVVHDEIDEIRGEIVRLKDRLSGLTIESVKTVCKIQIGECEGAIVGLNRALSLTRFYQGISYSA